MLNTGDLSADISALLTDGQEIYDFTNKPTGGIYGASGGLEDRVRRYLDSVSGLAQKYGCTGFSISVGFPFGVTASLNFDVPKASGVTY